MKIKNLKYNLKRICALTTCGFVFVTCGACTKKEEIEEKDYSNYDLMVSSTTNELDKISPNTDGDINDNSAIVILLSELAPENENGKISNEIINQYKINIDADNMIDDYNSFLDEIHDNMIDTKKVIKVSSVLPSELDSDKIILSNIEDILSNIINSTNKGTLESNFNKIYKLFVEEDIISNNNIEFKVRDLTYSSREIANMYGEVAAYFASKSGYISDDKIKELDDLTNDQNSKMYINEILAKLDNSNVDSSECDINELFNKYYSKLNIDNKKDLINILNMEYLNSDKVSERDKNNILNNYNDFTISNVLTTIDAINTSNLKSNNQIIYSNLLVDNYRKTNTGQTDIIALNFVQFNSYKLYSQINEIKDYNTLVNNPYYNNLYKYLTKQEFTHNVEENGKVSTYNIEWQEISDGANLINYETILYTLNKFNIKEIDSVKDKLKLNLSESVKYVQSTYTGECSKVNIEKVLTK